MYQRESLGTGHRIGSLRIPPHRPVLRPPVATFIDLFAGIGGFRIALERKGLECVFTSEIDQAARNSYTQNFNGSTIAGDINAVPECEVPKHDILCAGFPCQSFSISGKRFGLDDSRGKLFYEIVRIAKYHQPTMLLLENVRNILTVDRGQAIRIIKEELEQIGYRVHYSKLTASHFGLPQARERVYFVCLLKGSQLIYQPPEATNEPIHLHDILDEIEDHSLVVDRKDIVIEKPLDPAEQLSPIRIGYLNKGGQGERIYHPNGHAITLSAYGGGVGARTGLYFINGQVRKLSIPECKRLMGFDVDHFVGNGIQGYRQLGNAVIPNMVERVFEGITARTGVEVHSKRSTTLNRAQPLPAAA